jgi:aldehyde:ferredoxin oxidoreductase
MKLYGYAGKGLCVDLSRMEIEEKEISDAVLKSFLGGVGLGIKLLYEEVETGTDPLGPGNCLILATGPLTGTDAPGSGAYGAITKSPLTGFASSAQANGRFGAYLKFSGYDFIVLKGKADKFQYLLIEDGKAKLLPADDLIGKDLLDTEDILRKRHGEEEVSVVAIGPSGENLVKFAAIANDHGHFAASGGAGAVMGSKKVKAIVVRRGRRKVPIKEMKKARDISALWLKEFLKSPSGQCYMNFGTAGHFLAPHWARGGVPVRNCTTNIFPNPEDFDGINLYQNVLKIKYKKHCYRCPCNHNPVTEVFKEGPYKGLVAELPEYEDLAAWGPNIGNTDPAAAVYLTDYNDRLGMDVKEATFVVSLVIECVDKGILLEDRLEGLSIHWGDVEGVKELLRRIAYREGTLGEVMGEGVLRTCQWIGGEAPNMGVYLKKGFAPHVHDPRARWGTLFSQSISNICSYQGIDMTQKTDTDLGLGPTDHHPELIAPAEVKTGPKRQVFDSLVLCMLPSTWGGAFKCCVEVLNAVTGWNYSMKDTLDVGERTINLLQMFNLREGMKPDETDGFSHRLGTAPVEGPGTGKSLAPFIKEIIAEYYRLMGWDKNGRPLPETLRKFGLEEYTM